MSVGIRRGFTNTATGVTPVTPWVATTSLNSASVNKIFTASSSLAFSPEYNQAWSVSVLIKFTSLAVSGQIFTKTKNGAPYSGQTLNIHPDGSMDFQFSSSQGPNWLRVNAAAGTFTTGVWYRITLTLDGTGTFAGTKLYVNNVSVATTNGANSLSATVINTTPFVVGGDWTGNYRNGQIKDLAWWNIALTPAQELALTKKSVNLSSLSSSGALQSLWRFETGIIPADTATTVYDRVGSYNLTSSTQVSGDYLVDVP